MRYRYFSIITLFIIAIFTLMPSAAFAEETFILTDTETESTEESNTAAKAGSEATVEADEAQVLKDLFSDCFQGNGTAENPYLIYNADDLSALRDISNEGESFNGCFFRMESDIHIKDADWEPISTYPTNAFYGTFDGAGHEISGLVCLGENEQNGLFGCLNGTVLNLGVVDGRIEGNTCGAIASHSTGNGRIVNCYSRMTVNSYRAGGIAGNFSGGKIIGCYTDCDFTAMDIGGIAYDSNQIVGCYTTNENIIHPHDSPCLVSTCHSIEESDMPSDTLVDAMNDTHLLSAYIGPIDIAVLCTWTSSEGEISLSNKMSDKGEYYDYLLTGSGTAEDPYTVGTPEQLTAFSYLVNSGVSFEDQYIYQTEDIDLAGIEWKPIGLSLSGCYFFGSYDGGGHCISNLTCSSNDNNGLFGMLGGTVMNLGIKSGSITGNCCGSIAGGSVISDSTPMIVNCYSTASVRGARAGGIADNFEGGYILGCYTDCELTGEFCGGIVSYNAAWVYNCRSTHDPIVNDSSDNTFVEDSAYIISLNEDYPTMVKRINLKIKDIAEYAGVEKERLHIWKFDETDGVVLSDNTYRFRASMIFDWIVFNLSALLTAVFQLFCIVFFIIKVGKPSTDDINTDNLESE